jgi:nucleotide-binding universal stress UspA family protein
MIRVRTVVVHIDFSPASKHLLEAGILLARSFTSRVLAATAIPIPGAHLGGYALPDSAPAYDVDYAQAAQQLEELVQSTPRSGVPVEPHVMTGNAPAVLLSLLGRTHADVLLLGVPAGRPLVMRMSRLQEKLYRHAPCPVLALNSAAVCAGLRLPGAGLAPGRPLRILICTRFDPPSEPAVLAGMLLARHYSAETTVLHIEHKGRHAGGESFNLCQFLAGFGAQSQSLLASSICPEWVEPPPKTVVRYGRTDAEIIGMAADWGADVLVIGARQAPLGVPLWPSLACRLAEAAPCPVLVIGQLGLANPLASTPVPLERSIAGVL